MGFIDEILQGCNKNINMHPYNSYIGSGVRYHCHHALIHFSDLQGCYESVILHPYNSRISKGAMRCNGHCMFTQIL